MFLFFVSTVMAILPVYTTSKLHAARINLRQTPSSNTGVLFNYVKGVVFGRKWAWFAKIFAGALRTPLNEILDPPLCVRYFNLIIQPIHNYQIVIMFINDSIIMFINDSRA